MVDFVVGKHYKYKDSGANYLNFECVYVTPEGNGVFKTTNGETFLYKQSAFIQEVKTPRKIKRYVGVFCDHVSPEKAYLSTAYDTEESCRHSIIATGWTVLDVIEIDWVEKV